MVLLGPGNCSFVQFILISFVLLLHLIGSLVFLFGICFCLFASNFHIQSSWLDSFKPEFFISGLLFSTA